ncbi:MAG TPA: hypothetical protein VHB79_38835 [Polyangiaceae bacterium]|nr:hypothetical protein [Polyangiaceae bacterium]
MKRSRPIRFVDFATRVLRVRLTPAQRVLCLVAFDGVEPVQLDPADRDLAAKLFGPVDEIPTAARAVLLVKKGARVGGSWIFGALYSLWRALTADLGGLAPGEHATALIVAPDTRLGRQVLRYALGAAKEEPSIAEKIEAETSDSFVLRRSDGRPVAIEVLPATRGGSALRGRSLVSAVLSEASFFRDESAVVNDTACFTAVAPRVMRGGMVVIESTPWAEQGLVYDLFNANWGAPATCLAADAPTLLMRPDPETAAIVERERLRDPDNAAREFDAQFMSGGSSLYFGAELASALDRDLSVRTSAPEGATVQIGGDIGLSRDASAFCAVHRMGEHITLADLLEMRPRRLGKGRTQPLSLRDVVQQGCEFAERHGQRVIHVDSYVLVPAREHLPQGFQLKAVAMANEHKAERYRLLKESLRNELVHIPGALVRVVTQLADVVAQPGPGGLVLIKHPRRQGSHGDAAAAFVIAASKAADRVRGAHWFEIRKRQERLAALEKAAGLTS